MGVMEGREYRKGDEIALSMYGIYLLYGLEKHFTKLFPGMDTSTQSSSLAPYPVMACRQLSDISSPVLKHCRPGTAKKGANTKDKEDRHGVGQQRPQRNRN